MDEARSMISREIVRAGKLARPSPTISFIRHRLVMPPSTAAGRLHRTWRAGRAGQAGVLDDYAEVANGLYELHVATGELRWLEEAHRLALLAVELFADDEHGGFFQTPSDGERLVVRRKNCRFRRRTCCGERNRCARNQSETSHSETSHSEASHSEACLRAFRKEAAGWASGFRLEITQNVHATTSRALQNEIASSGSKSKGLH